MTSSIKINKYNIDSCDSNIFGEWFHKKQTINTDPFRHIIIENFLNEEYLSKLLKVFPNKPTNDWHYYENPIELKYTYDNINKLDDAVSNYFYALSHSNVVSKFREIFNIDDLEYDPYCHGGGLHMHPKYGRLNLHLDYEKHPILNKQRRLNIILYLNEKWDKIWNGDTQLWNRDAIKCIIKSYPKLNTALIFETTELSWHGLPEKILCPNDYFRKTLAYYYISPIKNKADTSKMGANSSGYRTKAVFIKRPEDLYDERMQQLYELRPHRRIEKEDMNKIWPEWNIYK